MDQMRKDVIASYDAISKNALSTANDISRAEQAKHNLLKELARQQHGVQKSILDNIKASWVNVAAGVYIAKQAYDAIKNTIVGLSAPFVSGFHAVEEYNTSISSLAAMVVTFSEKQDGVNLAGQWNQALSYSSRMVPVLEEIASRTLLSGRETTSLANAFARSGVFLDDANQKQIESFTRISNALPLMTQGQDIMKQINTEIRSLMTGSNESTSMLLTTLKAIDPELEKNLKTWRQEGTVLEHIGDLLVGFGPATALLELQWQAVKSTLDTTANQILRDGMQMAYADIIDSAKRFNTVLVENKAVLTEMVKTVGDNVAGVINKLGSAVEYAISQVKASQTLDEGLKLTDSGSKERFDFLKASEKEREALLELLRAQDDVKKNIYRSQITASSGPAPKGAFASEDDKKAIDDVIKSLEKQKLVLQEGEEAQLKKILVDHNASKAQKDYAQALIDTISKEKDKVRLGKEAEADTERRSKAIDDYVAKLNEEAETLGMSERAMAERTARQLEMTEVQVQAAMAVYDSTAAQKAAMKAAKEASDAIEDDDKKRQEAAWSIVTSLEEEAEALNKTTLEIVKMKLARQGISESDDEYRRAMAAATKIETDKNEKEYKEQLKKQEEDTKHYLERIQDTTADTYADIMKNMDEGFQGVFDRATDYFIDMLAEWAAQATVKPIIIPMIQSITGTWEAAGGTDSSGGLSTSGLLQMAGNTIGNNYFGNTSLSGYISGAMATNLGSSGTTLYATGLDGSLTGTSAIGSGYSYTLGSALTAYGLGSAGYTYLGGAMGLPQGEYSGYGAGAGAALGAWGGAKLGATMGSYWPGVGNIVGGILGAIAGGLGASFIGGDGNRHMGLLSTPELSYGGEVNYSTGGYDYDAYRNRSITDTSTNPYYGSAFGTMEDATNAAAEQVWASVDETLAMFPADIAAGIKQNLEALTFKFNEDHSWVIASDDFQSDLNNILTVFVNEIYDGIQPVMQQGFADYAQGLVKDETLSGLFGRLSENNILKTSLGDTSIFSADYGMASGGDFNTYIETVNSWLNSFSQLETAFATVDATVENILHPMTAFEKEISGINTQFDSLKTTLYTLGAATDEYTKIEEARQEAIVAATAAEQERKSGIYSGIGDNIDAWLNPMSEYESMLSDIDKKFKDYRETLVDLEAPIEDLTLLDERRIAVLERESAAYMSSIKSDLVSLRSKWEPMNDMEIIGSRYGLSTSQMLDKTSIAEAYTGFMENPESLIAVADQFGVTTDQVVQDLGYIIDSILDLDKAAKGFTTFKLGLQGMSGTDLTLNTLGTKYNWGSDFGSTGNWDYKKLYTNGIQPILEMSFEDFNDLAKSLGMTWEELESDTTSLSSVFNGLSDAAEQSMQTFSDLSDSISDQIRGMQISTDNPADVYERLGIAKESISDFTGGKSIEDYLNSLGTDAEKAAGITELQSRLGEWKTLAQEAYQRPSDAYQTEYGGIIGGLNTLLGYSNILKSDYQLQYEQTDYLKQIVDNTSVLGNIPKYAAGGSTGPGGLAILHPDEWVLNKDQTDAYLNGSLSPQYYYPEDDRRHPTDNTAVASDAAPAAVNIYIEINSPGDPGAIAKAVVEEVKNAFPYWARSDSVIRTSIKNAATGK